MTRQLTINFYRLLPDSDLFPVLRRKLDEGESKRDWETLLKVPTGDSFETYSILSQWPFDGDTTLYARHSMRFDVLPRQTRVRLLDDSLAHSFRQRGLDVVRRKFSFTVHGNDALVSCPIQGIELRRGVEFQLDSIFLGERRHYGYFINLKVSRSFSVGLDNPALRNAATGQCVYWKEQGPEVRVILEKANHDDAVVSTMDGSTQSVSASSVKVPASFAIVKRYLLEIGKGSDALGQLLSREQQVAMRRTPKGQKRRDASKAQTDYVSTWLVNNSEYGRIRFYWAFSDAVVSLVTTQHSVRRVEDF